jgi:lytic murein transglycosylase
MLKSILFVVGLCVAMQTFADEKKSFSLWLNELRAEAKQYNVSDKTINQFFKNADYVTRVIELDRAQPESISTFLAYVNKRVNSSRVATGRRMLQEHYSLLERVEVQYGVPKEIIVAFWGLETNYGSNKGAHSLPSSLITLGYEGRRAKFFRQQLIDAMRIIEAGHNNVAGMRGSWAGAMGHMQFMPSTFLRYGVDADADGRINVWTSLPDAFSSAANYLSGLGWQKNEPAAVQVLLPPFFPYQEAHLLNRKESSEWVEMGVVDANGMPLPELQNTAILLPQGWQGPAFMVASNFDLVMDWNRSINYALSVSHLADQFLEDKPIVGDTDVNQVAFNLADIKSLQAKLNAMGYDSGFPDGFPGLKTQNAIRAYQIDRHLPADGFASDNLLNRVLQEQLKAQPSKASL